MDEPPLGFRPRQARGVAAGTGRTAPSVTEQPRRPPSRPPWVYLAQRSERRAHLLGEQLGLLPGGEVPALIDLVEIGEVGVCLLARLRGGVGPDTGVRRKLGRNLLVRPPLGHLRERRVQPKLRFAREPLLNVAAC
jgi:hypothetical protein